jgi:hypothetical protein
MTKKILLITSLVFVLLVALPMIGNMSVTAMIDSQLRMLEQNGVEVSATDDKSSYLLTRMHYGFRLADKAKLMRYLQSLSTTQIPSFLNAVLEDVELAADVSYSNLPFQDDVALELYPSAVSKKARERLRRSDPKLLASLEKMIADKAMLYHLNYNTAAQSFNGYVKDLDERLAFEDGTTAEIVLQAVTFRGNGSLMAPKESAVAIKEAKSTFDHAEKGKMRFALEGYRNENSFSAEQSQEEAYSLQNVSLFYEERNTTFEFSAEEVELFSSTYADGEKINGTGDFRASKMKFGDENSSLALQSIALKFSAEGIDEAAYDAFSAASRQGSATAAGLVSSVTSLETIIAKGFSLEVERFSVKNLSVSDSPQMNGFEHTLQMVVRPAREASRKPGINPKALLENIDANLSLRFADDFYTYLEEKGLMHGIDPYAIADGDSIVFEVLLEKGDFIINGRPLNDSTR